MEHWPPFLASTVQSQYQKHSCLQTLTCHIVVQHAYVNTPCGTDGTTVVHKVSQVVEQSQPAVSVSDVVHTQQALRDTHPWLICANSTLRACTVQPSPRLDRPTLPSLRTYPKHWPGQNHHHCHFRTPSPHATYCMRQQNVNRAASLTLLYPK